MTIKSKQSIVKSQGLFSKLREVRESNQGVVIYHFEVIREVFNKQTGLFEFRNHTWTQQSPINPAIFLTSKGKNEDLEKVADIFKTSADDLGAKFFSF